ncbi:MAG TPA: SMP-30/gluconolactonase/LRE family protein, partial [Nitrososphaeraceae archaeon]|nr:SMP-30/gluconolactonase/LRE family protein [Nitrososphaeraceae archaeon]
MITRNMAINLFFVVSLCLVSALFGTIITAVNDQSVYASENATSYKFIKKWGGAGSDDGQFLRPHDLDFSPDEKILYAVDRDGSRIQAFDKNGKFLFKFGEDGTGDGQMHVPYGIDVDKNGNVWLADRANDRVQEFDSKGKFILKFGNTDGVPSAEEGKFDN